VKIKAGQSVINAIILGYHAMRSILLEGPHGIGKSDLIIQAAKILGIECIVRDLSLMEPPDLIGLPREKGGRTVYAPPSFLPERGKGLLVFEELNRSDKYMMSPCLQLLTARRLNDYVLPDGWLTIAAINPAGGAYDVAELDPALLSRFIRIPVIPDVESWLNWAGENSVHESVRRYVHSVPDIFESTNPRSWTYVSDLVHAFETNRQTAEPILRADIAGLVGDVHTTAFMKIFRSAGVSVTAEDILRHYRKVQPTILSWRKQKKMDFLAAIVHELQVQLQGSDLCAEIAESQSMSKNLSDFIGDLPADLSRKVRSAATKMGVL
jgi:MoxR-like ATPase